MTFPCCPILNGEHHHDPDCRDHLHFGHLHCERPESDRRTNAVLGVRAHHHWVCLNVQGVGHVAP